ncbi:MAG: FecR domain-containing protein [Bacteroidota bacterium]
MTEQTEFSRLFSKYIDGTATAAETRSFLSMANQAAYQQELETLVDAEITSQKLQHNLDAAEKQAILDHIFSNTEQQPAKTRRLWQRIAIAASILIACSTGSYFLLHQTPVQQVASNTEELAPVQHGVTLTLANGQKIVLSQRHTGQIATVNGTRINQQDSLLRYQGKAVAEDVKMNTLTNNGSSKFSVTLADGTEAILDVSSSLTYPNNFTGKDRQVVLNGQGYFKVKHDAAHPFIIKAGDEVIEDIGTEFNVKAYGDEAVVKTTLIAGAVKVSANDRSVVLKPGEQALDLLVKPANIEEATAWLQGQLVFHHERLENILHTVARVYGVTIIWQDEETKAYTFGGSVNRNDKLASVLNYFRKAGKVDFKVEGKTVKVFKRKK